MLPQGRIQAPVMVLAMVQGDGDRYGAVYRRNDGRVYVLGLKYERVLWRRCGYRYMGSIPFLRDRYATAQRTGVREKSLVWYLLTDVEQELQGVSGK